MQAPACIMQAPLFVQPLNYLRFEHARTAVGTHRLCDTTDVLCLLAHTQILCSAKVWNAAAAAQQQQQQDAAVSAASPSAHDDAAQTSQSQPRIHAAMAATSGASGTPGAGLGGRYFGAFSLKGVAGLMDLFEVQWADS